MQPPAFCSYWPGLCSFCSCAVRPEACYKQSLPTPVYKASPSEGLQVNEIAEVRAHAHMQK